MPTRKQRVAFRGVGRQTKKTSGYITTSLRLLAQENRELRKHARSEGMSFNGWAVHTLLNIARKGTANNAQANNTEA